MAERKTIEFVDTVLSTYGISDFLAFKDEKDEKKRRKFPLICLDIVDQMTDALMEEAEVEVPVGTLKAVENGLLKLTRAVVKLRRTPFSGFYPLGELEPLIDNARKKVSGAINEHQKRKPNTDLPVYSTVDPLIDYILECRYALEEVRQKVEDFSSQN